MSAPDVLEVCATCASLDTEYEAWVHANTGRVLDVSGDGEAWCPRCGEHDVALVHVVRSEPGSRWWRVEEFTLGGLPRAVVEVDVGGKWRLVARVIPTTVAGYPTTRTWLCGEHGDCPITFLSLRTALRVVRAIAKATAAP